MTSTTLRSAHPQQQPSRMDPAPHNGGLRAAGVRRWVALIAKVLLPGGLFAISLFGALANPAQAQAIDPNTFPGTKLSADLVAALNAPKAPSVKWVKQDSNGRYVKVLIMAAGGDPQLIALRSAIIAARGSVY